MSDFLTAGMNMTAAEIRARRETLGASDIGIIMRADPDEVRTLWEIKIGAREPDDLTDVLPVQMGIYTEGLNLMWFERRARRGEVKGIPAAETAITSSVIWRGKKFQKDFDDSTLALTCTLDGAYDGCVVQCKHVNAFSSMDEAMEKYYPQLQQEMMLTGCPRAYLSVFIGTLKWECEPVEASPLYQSHIVSRAKQFWAAVVAKQLPPKWAPITPPKIDAHLDIDMTTRPQAGEWKRLCEVVMQTKGARDSHDDAMSTLRSMVPPEAKMAFGGGVQFKRDKRGALRVGFAEGG